MSINGWIVLGGLAGWVASIIKGSNGSMGLVRNIIACLAGAFVGGWIFSLFGNQGVTGFNFASFIVALLGAIVIIFGIKLFTK